MSGTLYVVSLPIGNVEDITLRALRILREVAIVAAENPEQVQTLFGVHDINTPLTSYHRAVQEEKAALLVHRLLGGDDVALVSDEGTPTICDPGTYLISKARTAGVAIVPVPGASALLAAIAVTGFGGDAFTFAGCLPRTSRSRLRVMHSLRANPRPVVFYAPARSLKTTLYELQQVFGDRRVLIACDMTQPGEHFFHGRIGQALKSMAARPSSGKFTLIMEGKSGRAPRPPSPKRKIKSPPSFESSRGRTGRQPPG